VARSMALEQGNCAAPLVMTRRWAIPHATFHRSSALSAWILWFINSTHDIPPELT
jgi:hypothetical protein